MKKNLPTLSVLALALASSLSALAAEPKRVIVCTVTTGFRHSSIPLAEKTIEKLGLESKAYTVVDWVRQPSAGPQMPRKPGDLKPDADDATKAKHADAMKKFDEGMAKYTAEMEKRAKEGVLSPADQMKAAMDKLSPANLVANKIDGVIFANTTGELPLPDPEGFIKWIEAGNSFCAMHSGSDTFHKFAPYLDMLQGQFAGHGAQVPADLVAADTAHPANAGIGEKWDLSQEEIYLIKNHDRAKVRSLWHLRHHPNKKATSRSPGAAWRKRAAFSTRRSATARICGMKPMP